MSQGLAKQQGRNSHANPAVRRAMNDGWGPIAQELGLDISRVDDRTKRALQRLANERQVMNKLAYVALHYVNEVEDMLTNIAAEEAKANVLWYQRQLQKYERDKTFVQACMKRGG